MPPGGAVLVAQPSGQLVSARKGAIVVSTDGAASIAIPPGALSEDTPIQLTSLRVGDFPNPSENEHLIGVVGGTPDGTRFRIPVRVRFLLAESIDPGALIDMLTFNAGTMQYASGEFAAIADQSGWTLSADVTHFTQFAVATGSARLHISDITPSIASVGATITVSGSGFSSIPNQNMVLFTSTRGNGTVTAVPLTASPGSLTVNVPSVATSGDVDVKVGSLRSHGMYLTVTTNQPPQMDAGPNQTINLPTGVLLSGTATDDGLPNGSLITTWSKVTGPGEVIFGNATGATDGPTGQAVSVNPSTPARFSVPGTYSLRLTASDGQFSSSSDVVVSVNPAVINGLAVSAGPDQTINVPSGANVSGTVTDTCSSCTLTTTWSQISGPGTATFADATALTTSVTFSVAGTYVLQLTTSNGVASSASIVTITVSLSSVGHMYFVDFDNGNDANSGTSPGSPWKHAPGDDNATGAANIILQPGDTVVFKGGVVYSGTSTQRGDRRVVAPNNSGTSVSPITLISGHMLSSPWGTGRAVIDGGGPGIDAAKTGIYVWDQAWITIQGFEIRNMGGPTPRAKVKNVFVTFRDGKSYAMADAPPLEPGAVVTVPEVALKWWQDYLAIAQAVASLVLGVTGLFVIFNGPIVK